MGDLCDMNNCERFMRSKEGQAHLEEIRQMLLGRTIKEVTFSNEIHHIATTLELDDGTSFVIFQPSLEVDVLCEEFADAIKREYYIDYPCRKGDDWP